MAKRYVYWALPDGQHFDQELGFHVRKGEIKPLPDVVPAGSLTAQRLEMRVLLECDPPAGAQENDQQEADPTEAEGIEATPEALAAARDQIIERRIEALQVSFTVAQLREQAKELGLAVNPRSSKQKLATEIAVAEWQREHGR